MARPRRRKDLVDSLLADPPLLHFWGGQPQDGGLGGRIGRQFVETIDTYAGDRPFEALETGAGLSTLLLLALGADRLTTVVPDQDLCDRIRLEAEARDIDTTPLEFIVDRSEVALPVLASSARRYDVCLIDGGHGWPTVFVDFCYANACMRQNGLFLIDDVQLHSVRQLYLLLAAQPGYRLVSEQWEWKLGAFIKETPDAFLPDFSGQPFIVANSLSRPV